MHKGDSISLLSLFISFLDLEKLNLKNLLEFIYLFLIFSKRLILFLLISNLLLAIILVIWKLSDLKNF